MEELLEELLELLQRQILVCKLSVELLLVPVAEAQGLNAENTDLR